MNRIYIPVDQVTKAALIELAEKELRDPRYQAAVIIRDELIRRGFLSKEYSASSLSIPQTVENTAA